MMDLKDGVTPETGIVQGKEYWICGYCVELIGEHGKPLPDKCPYCGTRIKKGDEN